MEDLEHAVGARRSELSSPRRGNRRGPRDIVDVAMLEVSLHASVDAIAEWDEIRPGGDLYTSSWWLRDSERIFADALGATYVVVRDDNRVAAAAACWTVPRAGIVLPPLEPSRLFAHWQVTEGRLVKSVVTPLSDDEAFPYTICGSPRGYEGRLLIRPELMGMKRREVVACLFSAVEQVARRAGARLVFVPYLDLGDTADALAGSEHLLAGYGMTDAYLSPVPSFDSFLASFNASRRRQIARDIKDFEAEGLRIELRRLSEIPSAADLVVGWREKFGWRAAEDYDRKALAVAAQFGDDKTRMFCAMHDDVLVGFEYIVCYEEAYYTLAVAADPERASRGALYFNMNFYAPIRHAAVDHVKRIHFGGGSLDVKYRRGCAFMPRWNLALPLVAWSNEARALMRSSSESMLDADRAQLAKCVEPDQLDEVLGVSHARNVLDPLTRQRAE
jgi:predicted N-acyltransferase